MNDAPLIKIAEALIDCLSRGKAEQLPTIDFAVEGVRSSLNLGVPEFRALAWKTFKSRLTPGRARIYYRIFMREIHESLAGLVLAGRVEP